MHVCWPRPAAPQDLSSDFVNILSSRIDEIEKTMLSGGSNSEREVGKARKKALREVVKYVTDRANPVEEKISFLQGKYAQQVGAQTCSREHAVPMLACEKNKKNKPVCARVCVWGAWVNGSVGRGRRYGHIACMASACRYACGAAA